MNPKTLISLSDGVISNPLRRLAAPASFELRQGEAIALIGPNGSGKSTLLEMIRGGFYLREGSLHLDLSGDSYSAIRVVKFDNAYSTTETQYYYQQRWQAFEREASPLAGELLEEGESEWRRQLFSMLDIEPLLGREIISLSSGELRRFSIARALLRRPDVLILESPFIGLDPATRQALCSLLEQVMHSLGVSIVMSLTDIERIPPMVTHIYLMDDGRISRKMTAGEVPVMKDNSHFDVQAGNLFCEAPAFGKVVEMRGVNIGYGERLLFSNFDWTVHCGEKWNVTGPNGSGKSTLLSLVNADNPRAYSLDIILFDRRRGTGESIWDIKRHIGYLSSEMHSSFREDIPVLEIVRSGFDYGCHAGDDCLMQWLKLFGAEHLAHRSYLTLSSGEQRYVLLVRAFVKDPDLLILDEPFQGLDPALRHRAAAVIEAFCSRKNKTLIFVTHYPDEIPGVVTDTLRL